ncbi:unnamed protein product [Lactuca saligna]|uniref:Uncharacterized protein n=1 Tax=Lactuca saligna TaxID=75948 RepID=A0AA35YDX8_LACSI|nr:unnamed protein product [Lactuca saligna]
MHYPFGEFPKWPAMTISNITKNRMWIYECYMNTHVVHGGCWVLLSHWMFGRNEMEAGDHVVITVTERWIERVKERGVSLVYQDDGEKKEEDVLGYYKSWNHIISRDLSPFQNYNRTIHLTQRAIFSAWHLLVSLIKEWFQDVIFIEANTTTYTQEDPIE